MVTSFSLPIDIPWKRLCVSDDMIDKNVCDRRFPYRWRSSVAAFSYEPPDEHQNYEGMTVSYLKIVCTITGFQPNPEEVGLKNRKIHSYWNDPQVIEDYENMVNKYYGCYGALLEVSVAPSGTPAELRTIPLSDYPYFADFEPKKRELYEIVTETGEMMSRSLENVNVRKGTTTTDTHEVLDIFGGFSQQFTYAGTGGGHSIQGQWGTKDINQQEYTNIRTTDQAREVRETFSNTTQLTQMYHQFTSYHLGTNRGIFFMLPRPHVIQSEYTFVNGPRLLEGVQEVFLVVIRPKTIKSICVEAYLETAHVFNDPVYEYETSTGPLTLHVEAKVQDRDCTFCFGDDSYTTYGENSETYSPPDGWEIDTARGSGGYDIASQNGHRVEEVRVTAGADFVTAYGKVSAHFSDNTWPQSNHIDNGFLDLNVTVYIRKKERKVVGYDKKMWITGRGVCCCEYVPRPIPGIVIPSDWVTFERPLVVEPVLEEPIPQPIPPRPTGIPATSILPTLRSYAPSEGTAAPKIAPAMHAANAANLPIGLNERMTVRQANRIGALIGRQMLQSINDPNRYQFGLVGFTDTEFIARSLAKIVRTEKHPDNHPIDQIEGLDPYIRTKISKVAPKVSRGRLLGMSIAEQMDRFGLDQHELVKLRRAALGIEGPAPDPDRKWERPGRTGKDVIVPDIVGVSLDQARIRLRSVGVYEGDITYQDNEKPKDTVLNQYPDGGSKVQIRSEVDLVLSSGATVQIPNIIGKPLTEALIMLRNAGLQSEPEIMFGPSDEQPKNHVLEVTPNERTFVTPHANATLQVSSGPTTTYTSKTRRTKTTSKTRR